MSGASNAANCRPENGERVLTADKVHGGMVWSAELLSVEERESLEERGGKGATAARGGEDKGSEGGMLYFVRISSSSLVRYHGNRPPECGTYWLGLGHSDIKKHFPKPMSPDRIPQQRHPVWPHRQWTLSYTVGFPQ